MKVSINSIPARFGRWLPMLIYLVAVSSSTALQSGDFIYEINCHDTSTVTITDYTGAGGDVIIPSTMDGRAVAVIRSHTFYYCDTMTSISIPDGVITIEPEAFLGCSGLTEVTIPDSVICVEAGAFRGCISLTNVVIGAGVAQIAMNAGDFCLAGAFSDCPVLHTISVDIANTVYSDIEGALFNQDQSTLVLCPCGKVGNYIVPAGVTAIAPSAFRDCTGLTGVNLPDSITTIGSMAFRGCTGLKSMTIPDGVASIAASAFMDCTSLTSVTIPDSITTIGSRAFYGCTGLKSMTIPDSTTVIASMAFYGCTSLTNATIPDSITTIMSEAFFGCSSLESVSIPESIVTIGDYAFCECTSLLSIEVDPDAVNYTSIDGALYDGDASGLIHFPGGVTKHYTIPAGVKTLKCASFSCSGLTSLTIPESVTSIEDCALHSCTKLTAVYFKGDAPTIGTDVYLESTKVTVYYLGGTTGWSSKLGGRTTKLWLSPLQCDFRKLSSQSDEVRFNIVGTANETVVVEHKNELHPGRWWEPFESWQPVFTNTIPVNDTLTFSDYGCTNQPTGFYRLKIVEEELPEE